MAMKTQSTYMEEFHNPTQDKELPNHSNVEFNSKTVSPKEDHSVGLSSNYNTQASLRFDPKTVTTDHTDKVSESLNSSHEHSQISQSVSDDETSRHTLVTRPEPTMLPEMDHTNSHQDTNIFDNESHNAVVMPNKTGKDTNVTCSQVTDTKCQPLTTGDNEIVDHMKRLKKKRHHSSYDSDQETNSRQQGHIALPPEIEEGKIEYKLKLVAPSTSRFEHLVTQMKWRLQEGAGEAIYEIGVEDCGTFIGLKKNELLASMNTLRSMAERLGATLTTLREYTVDEGRKAVEVLVRKVPDDQQFLDLRIAVLGNVECGKSTLVGVLSHGELDNGRGRARLNLFRHRHEIQSGRTSSISQEIIGFDSEGEIQNYQENNTAEDICENSSKIIQFIDVPGHQKYLKTTIFGLMGHSPHFAMLVMNANTGIVGTTREQLGFALCLQVPIFVVVTKIDVCRPSVLEKNLSNMEQLLKSPGSSKLPLRVRTESDAVNAATKMTCDKVVPIFKVSSKTGAGMDLLHKFLNVLPPTASSQQLDRLACDENLSFQIDDVFSEVPDVGLVISGTIKKGCIKEDDELLAGPLDDGSFTTVKVTSMHRNRFACRLVKAGQAAALALTPTDPHMTTLSMRKGMVLCSTKTTPPVCEEFEAKINLLFHKKCIKIGFQCTVHVGSVCQTAEISSMSTSELKTNGSAKVTFKFLRHPEVIYTDSKLLFRQGTTRGIGTVTGVTNFQKAGDSADPSDITSSHKNCDMSLSPHITESHTNSSPDNPDTLTDSSQHMTNSDSGYISE